MSVANEKKEVVPGFTAADVKEMADKVFNWTDGNHPQVNSAENGFLNILRNGKSEVSSSPAFIRKITL
jgi:ATP sulfurylase